MRWWDIEAIVPLEQAVFADDPPWSVETFWSELAGVPELRWYGVAEDGGTLVGYTGLLAPSMPGEPADILTIAVDPAYRRRGYGTVLMTGLIAQARGREAGDLMLEVRADNETARAFYHRSGFDRIAVRRNYYRGNCDAIVMRRRIPRRRVGD